MKPSKKLYILIGSIAFGVWLALFKTCGIITQNFSVEAFQFSLDRLIPVTPLFVWPYFLAYIIPFAPFLFKMNYRAYNHALVTIFFATLSAFWMYSVFPLFITQPELGSSLSERLLQWQYDIDFKPGSNKMPALHVVLPLLIATYFARVNAGLVFKSIWFFLVFLICISALFTKQHVLIDVLVGIGWAIGSYLVIEYLFRKNRYHKMPELASLKKSLVDMLKLYLVLTVVAVPLLLGLKALI